MHQFQPSEILTNVEMAKADRLAIEGGVESFALMLNAGQAVVQEATQAFSHSRALILCGPGNNGGDGFVIGRLLREKGWSVRMACMIPADALKGDAARACTEWSGDVEGFDDLLVAPDELVVDAVFGTGLSKALEGPVVGAFERVREAGANVVAVDIPTGVDGDTGAADPHTLQADLTVTFFRKQLGHVLMPGMAWCGMVAVHNIGIPYAVLPRLEIQTNENMPDHWLPHIRPKTFFDNKYTYGHAIVFGGPRMTGAACLAAHAALRTRVGMCTIVGDEGAADVYRSYLPNLIYEPYAGPEDFPAHLQDERRNAALIGPGAGRDNPEGLRQAVLGACAAGDDKTIIVDADALNVFEDSREDLYKALRENCIITPHEGEFVRIFPDLKGNKLDRAKEAAKIAGCVVLLKGPDTVIAAPDGRSAVNTNAPPVLATAGSGDVLAGVITGLAAQRLEPFYAACAGAWIHGETGYLYGPGLMASDLPDLIPQVLRELS